MLRIFLSLMVFVTVACTETESRNNEHSQAPEVVQPTPSQVEVSVLARGLEDISTFRGPRHEALRQFFEDRLSEEFLRNLERRRNPQELRDLSQFHRLFHQHSLNHPEDRGVLAELSYDYYQRLISVCADQFQTCPVLGLYTHSVYAGNVFLLAEPLVPETEKERYILFTTNIGYPQNTIPVIERRLHWMVEDISDDAEVDILKIQKLTNLIIYLSLESQSFPEEPVEALFALVKKYPSNTPLVDAFENILNISLEQDPTGSSMEIAHQHVMGILSQSNLEDVLMMQNNQGLIRWKGELQSFGLAENWQLYYVLYGFLNPQYSGILHSYFFAHATESPDKQKQLFDISLSYIYKKFVRNAYFSHERIGSIWQEEFERFGKVEPMFFEFFRRADATLAEIWNVSYKREVERIINEITPYYSSEELKPIKQIENNLDANIRNIVAYPTQFISGYFASRQGDFDFKFFIVSGFLDASIVHMNDNYFFKEHFDGTAPVIF